MPTNQRRRPVKRRASAISPSAISSAASGLRGAEHRLPHPLEPRRVVEQRADAVGDVGEVEVADHHRAARVDEVAPRSSPGGRRSRRDTGRGSPASPPPRSPRPSCRRARARGRRPSRRRRCGRSRGSAGSRRGAAGSSATSSRAHRRCAAPRGPTSPNASITISLIERAPASAPATSSTGPCGGSSKISRASALRDRAGSRRDRPADDAEARLVEPRERVGEEHALARTGARAGSRARGGRRPRRARPGCASTPRRAPSARRRSRRRRRRRRSGAGAGSRGRRAARRPRGRAPRGAPATAGAGSR